jgi:hypothetical protein
MDKGGKAMTIGAYFEQKDGIGVLATSDSEGRVDAAIYARPYVADEGTVAFIMADHLSRKNILSNPHAAYLFIERGQGYEGKRLFLTMLKELDAEDVREPELKAKYDKACRDYPDESLSVVYFKVDKINPLIGADE